MATAFQTSNAPGVSLNNGAYDAASLGLPQLTYGLTSGLGNVLGSNAVSPTSTTPDASEQGFGGAGTGSLTGVDQSMPNSLNHQFINPGGYVSGLLTGIYGGKYQVPDPGNTAGAAIAGNTGNLGALEGLDLGSNAISAMGAAEPYQMNLPGYSSMLQSASGNVGQELSGQLPQDVQNQIATSAAERGISTGQGAGSPNDNAALLSSLGLNSLEMQNMGMQGFGQLMQQTPVGPQFNPSTMYVTPEQQQAAQLAANEEAAAPQPQLSGLINTVGGMF